MVGIRYYNNWVRSYTGYHSRDVIYVIYILIGMGYATEAISTALQYYLAQPRETIKAKG